MGWGASDLVGISMGEQNCWLCMATAVTPAAADGSRNTAIVNYHLRLRIFAWYSAYVSF